MKKGIHFLTAVLMLVIFSSRTQAEVAPREYERIAKEFSGAFERIPNLTRPEMNFDELLSRRDPLRPLIDLEGRPVKGTGLSDGLTLQGIIHSEGFTRVLIDDQLYSEGDAVGPFKLRKIRQDGIELEQAGSVTLVPLYRDSQEKKGSIT